MTFNNPLTKLLAFIIYKNVPMEFRFMFCKNQKKILHVRVGPWCIDH